MRKTKIVCTLGPATDSVDIIKELIDAGMGTARINFSHGTYESHGATIERLKEARECMNIPVALLLDTKGPEIRTKTLKEKKVYLERGHSFILTTRDIEGDLNGVSVTYEHLPDDVETGTRILIDDGLIELRVTEVKDADIHCFVENGGFLSDRKGINIPDVFVNLPSLTEKDVEDIIFGIKNDFDFIAASFIRKASDVVKIRRVLEENGGAHIQIIAKIENRDGVNNIDEIIAVADGIMVARGDLGVEIPPEEVPIVQKLLIKKANEAGKPVITATQMLESMNTNPRPTRAEANDVANAILDGTDCVMLSGETAKGQYPVESVKMMARIAEKAESAINYTKSRRRETFLKNSITNSISHAACTASSELKASCIATVTNSGFTARMVSKFRPECPIVACALKPSVWRQLNLISGVKPMLIRDRKPINGESVFNLAIEKAVEACVVKEGDIIVLVAGTPVGATGATNTLKIEMVGNVLAKGKGVGSGKVAGKSCIVKVFDEIDKYFKQGDILVTPETTNDWIPYVKKASGLIVGPLDDMDSSCHAEIVSAALEIPVIICNTKVVEAIPNDTIITLDLDNGLVFNGDRRS